MHDPAILLSLGMAMLAAAGWWNARRWRRAYRQSLARFGELLTAAPKAERKSPAHVQAARTRAERERAKRLATAERLAAEAAARPTVGGYDPNLVRSGWQ